MRQQYVNDVLKPYIALNHPWRTAKNIHNIVSVFDNS